MSSCACSGAACLHRGSPRRVTMHHGACSGAACPRRAAGLARAALLARAWVAASHGAGKQHRYTHLAALCSVCISLPSLTLFFSLSC